MLESTKRWIYWAGLSKTPLTICNQIIPNLLVQFVYLAYILSALSAYLTYAYQEKVYFQYITSATFTSLCVIQMLLVYIDLMRISAAVQSALDHLDRIVMKSKFKNEIRTHSEEVKKVKF